MKKAAKKLYLNNLDILKRWANENILGIFIFNLVLISLLLLRSAGYFAPFFEININLIVMVSLILLIFLLKFKSNGVFILTGLFWLFAAFLRVAGVNIWAERTAVYAYEALVVGVGTMIVEVIFNKSEYAYGI